MVEAPPDRGTGFPSNSRVESLPIHHIFTHYQSLGGVQTVLKRHAEMDSTVHLNSSFTLFFDPPSAHTTPHQIQGLGLTGRSSIQTARTRLWNRSLPAEPKITVAHNAWGLPFWADLDPASRRIATLHSDWPGIEPYLIANQGLLDGILCVSKPLCELAARTLPELAPNRIGLIHCPIQPGVPTSKPRLLAHRPLRIGISGRVQKEQKRVDRLPDVIKALDAAGLDYQIELAGDGKDRPWLEQTLNGHPRVRFLGLLTGTAYWAALDSWDVLLFLSDYEGIPLTLLEALSIGILPIYPQLGTGGDPYVSNLDERLLYPRGDIPALADRMCWLRTRNAQTVNALQERARTSIEPHREETYFNTFSSFLRETLNQPRISATGFHRPPRPLIDRVPFGLLDRLAPNAAWRSPLPGSLR